MALFRRASVSKDQEDSEFGRLYVIKLVLKDGTEVHKVGMCNSARSTDRMMEVLRSFFMQYRYVPYAELRRDKKVRIPYIVENYMHNLLDEHRFSFDKKFDGCTEFFEIDEDAFLDYLDNFEYGELLRGETSVPTERYEAICEAIRKERDEDKPRSEPDKLPF